MEYDYGLELAIRESQPTSGGEAKRDSPAPPMDIMRPGGGLGLVVGMMAEFVTANASGTFVVSRGILFMGSCQPHPRGTVRHWTMQPRGVSHFESVIGAWGTHGARSSSSTNEGTDRLLATRVEGF